MTLFNTVVEIGCHYQNTVLDIPECNHAEIWMVDAVDEFIKLIPNTNNVHKICAAITPNYTGKSIMKGIALSTQQENNLPVWSTTMATLRDHHPTIKKFEWENLLSNFEVDCYSVSDAWSTFNLPKEIDFLSTDLEGLDFEVLLSIFNNDIKPKVLRFESKLMNEDDFLMLRNVLENNGLTNIIAGDKKDYNGIPFNHWAWSGDKPSIEMS